MHSSVEKKQCIELHLAVYDSMKKCEQILESEANGLGAHHQIYKNMLEGQVQEICKHYHLKTCTRRRCRKTKHAQFCITRLRGLNKCFKYLTFVLQNNVATENILTMLFVENLSIEFEVHIMDAIFGLMKKNSEIISLQNEIKHHIDQIYKTHTNFTRIMNFRVDTYH